MRILHLTTFLQGGAGRVIVELARAQNAGGHSVSVLASRRGAPGYGNYPEYLDELAAAGIAVHLVDSTFERSHAHNLASVTALNRLFKQGQEPHVLHSHAAIPSLVGLLFAGTRPAPIAVLQTMHGWGTVKTPDQVITDVSLLNLVDRVAVTSAHSAETLCSLGVTPSQIAIVPCGVTEDTRELAAADLDVSKLMVRARNSGRMVLACVGTFGARKNQTLLVDAVSKLTDVDVLAVFIGDGDDRDLRAAVASRNCADKVLVHGYSKSARALAAKADVLVLPSRSEGQPIAILEAFCDRTLVVASDIPELAELVHDRVTGFTFRSEDSAALARVIARIATMNASYRQSMVDSARERYESRFTLQRMNDSYVRAYQELWEIRRSADGRSAA